MRRIESMQQSSTTPKNQDVGRGLWKIVACSQSPSQCLLVATVFGTVSSLHFTLVLLIFAYHKYGQDTEGWLGLTECYCTSIETNWVHVQVRTICTKWRLRHPEIPVELSILLSDSCNESVCNKGSSTIGHRVRWCVSKSW